MKLEIYGGPKHGGWSAHGEHERGVDSSLKSCPFCGSIRVTVENTHTPYYTAECLNCSAEGPRAYGAGDEWGRKTSRAQTREIHEQAFRDAIAAWNERA